MKKNLWLKIASVVVAMAMWLFVISRGQSSIKMEVPIQYRNVPVGMHLSTGLDSETVELTVKGHQRFLKNLKPEHLPVIIDVKGLKEGGNAYRLRISDIEVPAPLKVSGISPSVLNINAEPSLRKSVPVKPVVLGYPGPGFIVRSVEVIPGEVMVEGGKSVVRKLRSLETEPLDITGAQDTVTADVPLGTRGGRVQPLLEEVMVKVIISKE